jgi:hypothetical protein
MVAEGTTKLVLFKGFSKAGLDHLKSVTAQGVKTP